MYRVLIVDDEPLLRFAVKNLVQWEEYGFKVVGEASDGVETLQRIRETKPDLILSDIRMPNMDGLEMAELLKKESRARVVIMSNYDDFQYAQAALRLGVDDYVLKSALNEELLGKILKEEKQRLDMCAAGDSACREEERSLETILSEVVRRGGISEGEAFDKYALINGQYRVIHLSILEEDCRHRMDKAQKAVYRNFMENILGQKLGGKGAYFFGEGGEAIILLSVYDYETMGGEKLFSSIVGLLERYSNRTYIAGISQEGKGNEQFYLSYQTACRAADRYFFQEGERVLTVEQDIVQRDPQIHEGLRHLFDMAGDADWVSGMRRAILQILEKMKETRLPSQRCKMILSNALLFYELRLMGEASGREENRELRTTETINERINGAGTYTRLCQEAEEILDEMGRRVNMKNSCSFLVQQTLQWIQENYKEHITLLMAAEQFATHPNHLSRVFSQQTGKSFSAYLNDYRMEKAMALLLDRALSVSDVGEQVGIPNGKYFSDVFKKWAGIAPREYRRMILKDEEEPPLF